MLELQADLKNLPVFIEEIRGFAEDNGLEHPSIMQIELAFEELAVNIIHYAYPENRNGTIAVSCARHDDAIEVTVTDHGVPFDLTAVADPDTGLSVDKRKVGGLGVLFIKKMMDEVKYERDGDKNIVRLIKKIK